MGAQKPNAYLVILIRVIDGKVANVPDRSLTALLSRRTFNVCMLMKKRVKKYDIYF